MTIPPGASVQAELFRANDTGGTPFNPAPPSVYNKTVSTTQMHGLGSLDADGNALINQTDQISPQNGQNLTTQELFRLRLKLNSNQQVNPVESPEVRGVTITVEGTYKTDYTFYSHINYSLSPALPEGISVISADGTRVTPIENEAVAAVPPTGSLSPRRLPPAL